MTLEARARPHVPNGKPLGRHVETASHRVQLLVRVPHTTAVPNGIPVGRHVLTAAHRREAALQAAANLAGRQVVGPRATRKHKRIALNAVTVISVSAGIVGTVALPSYAVSPAQLHSGGLRMDTVRPQPQTFAVSADAEPAVAVRDSFTAPTLEELEEDRERRREKERALAEAKQRAIKAAAAGLPVEALSPAALPGPVFAVPKNAPPAEEASIVAVARQYLGVPYVFGGASPAGFDCSGLVLYVYAQFGITLPHSSLRQGAEGARVVDPAPGDIIVIDGGSHIGIYSGGGYMIDAPMPGRVVNERPIYTLNHYFVRY